MDDRIERLGGIQRFADSYRIYNPWRDKVRRGTLDISARSNDSKFPFHRPWNNRNAVRSNEKGLIFYDPIFFWYLERKSKPLLHSRTRGESMKKRLFIHPHDSPRRRRLKKRKTAPFSRADELFRGRPRLEITNRLSTIVPLSCLPFDASSSGSVSSGIVAVGYTENPIIS